MKLSWPMRRVLVNLYQGRHPWGHIRGQSAHGGAVLTRSALYRRKLITDVDGQLCLTTEGHRAAEESISRSVRSA